MAATAYLSCHTVSPVAASRQVVTSSAFCRVKTYSLSPIRAGDAAPKPTVTFHRGVNALGHVFGIVKPVTLLSRLGPRHCGQSCTTRPQALRNRQPSATHQVHFVVGVSAPFGYLPVAAPGTPLPLLASTGPEARNGSGRLRPNLLPRRIGFNAFLLGNVTGRLAEAPDDAIVRNALASGGPPCLPAPGRTLEPEPLALNRANQPLEEVGRLDEGQPDRAGGPVEE